MREGRLALATLARATQAPGIGVRVLLQALFLDLWDGAVTRARRAAARLDMLVDPREPAFERELALLRRQVCALRVAKGAGGRGVRTGRGIVLLLSLAREPTVPSGRVAAVLLAFVASTARSPRRAPLRDPADGDGGR